MGEVIAFTFGLSHRFRQLKEEEEEAEKEHDFGNNEECHTDTQAHLYHVVVCFVVDTFADHIAPPAIEHANYEE